MIECPACGTEVYYLRSDPLDHDYDHENAIHVIAEQGPQDDEKKAIAYTEYRLIKHTVLPCGHEVAGVRPDG